MEILPGKIIQGPRWLEPVEVKQFEDLGGYHPYPQAVVVGAPPVRPPRKMISIK